MNVAIMLHKRSHIQLGWSLGGILFQGHQVFAINGLKKIKGFQYLLPSDGPRADPCVQVTVHHPPGSRLPLLSTLSIFGVGSTMGGMSGGDSFGASNDDGAT